jgi:importin subunit beta-1
MVKPAILAVFGEIALAIGGAFEGYLPVVMQLLQQAATLGSGTREQPGAFEMLDYIDSLNEGILEAYSGVILGLKGAGKGLSRNYRTNFSRCSCAIYAKFIWVSCTVA